jgi:hypothetical protein
MTLTEPVVKGTSLNLLLTELISAIQLITVPTALGPSGTPLNIMQLNGIAAKLTPVAAHLSQFVEVT